MRDPVSEDKIMALLEALGNGGEGPGCVYLTPALDSEVLRSKVEQLSKSGGDDA